MTGKKIKLPFSYFEKSCSAGRFLDALQQVVGFGNVFFSVIPGIDYSAHKYCDLKVEFANPVAQDFFNRYRGVFTGT